MPDRARSDAQFICVMDVPELRVIQENNDSFTFGSAITIATMEETLKDCVEKLPGELEHYKLTSKQLTYLFLLPPLRKSLFKNKPFVPRLSKVIHK